MAVGIAALRADRTLPPGRFLVLISDRDLESEYSWKEAHTHTGHRIWQNNETCFCTHQQTRSELSYSPPSCMPVSRGQQNSRLFTDTGMGSNSIVALPETTRKHFIVTAPYSLHVRYQPTSQQDFLSITTELAAHDTHLDIKPRYYNTPITITMNVARLVSKFQITHTNTQRNIL
jgi:hypothetical protein